jgi:site-specific DNA-adenine methylase
VNGMSEPYAAPFPWFGGKRRAASAVWAALGDVGGYVEPFAGSAAVLLARPRFTGRRVETINDADAWLGDDLLTALAAVADA